MRANLSCIAHDAPIDPREHISGCEPRGMSRRPWRHLVDNSTGCAIQAETIGHLREDTEMLGRQLREEAEELRAEVGMAARQLLAEVEVLTEQMTERAQRLRGEVEAWSGVLPHMA